jgi:hypothetical protein
MFVNSPADYNYQETKSSLYFGSEVKRKFRTQFKRIFNLEEIRRLKEGNEMLRK